MARPRLVTKIVRAIVLVSLLLAAMPDAPAERLPIKTYTTAYWVATDKGLCRFIAEPVLLPANELFRLFEDSRADIWISTLGNAHDVLTRWERATGHTA